LGSGDLTPARLDYLARVTGPLVQVHGQLEGAWIDTSPWTGVTGAELTIDGVTVAVYYRAAT
jgi:hypothetical protein